MNLLFLFCAVIIKLRLLITMCISSCFLGFLGFFALSLLDVLLLFLCQIFKGSHVNGFSVTM